MRSFARCPLLRSWKGESQLSATVVFDLLHSSLECLPITIFMLSSRQFHFFYFQTAGLLSVICKLVRYHIARPWAAQRPALSLISPATQIFCLNKHNHAEKSINSLTIQRVWGSNIRARGKTSVAGKIMSNLRREEWMLSSLCRVLSLYWCRCPSWFRCRMTTANSSTACPASPARGPSVRRVHCKKG